MLSGPPQWAKVKVIHTFGGGFRKALKGREGFISAIASAEYVR